MNKIKRTFFVMPFIGLLTIAYQANAIDDISQTVSVSTPSIETFAGKSFDLPINVSPELTSTDSIIAYQFDLQYDKNLVQFQNVNTSGSLSTGGIVQYKNDTTTGVLRIGYAQKAIMAGAKPLVFVTFKSLAKGSFTPNFTAFYLDTFKISNVTSGAINISNYKISGSITSSTGSGITLGTMFLYQKNNDAIVKVDSVVLTTNSSYSFNNIAIGTYTMYFVPDASIVRALSIYLGNTPTWETATFIEINATTTTFTYDFTVPILPELTGKGIIKGHIELDTNIDWSDIIPKSTQGKPVKALSVVLKGKKKSSDESIIAETETDENGDFEFTNIPDGNYSISVNMIGVPMIDLPEVVVSQGEAFAADGKTTFEVMELVVTAVGIETVSDIFTPTALKNEAANTSFIVYPNPAKNRIYISFSDASICKEIRIISVDGKVVFIANNIANNQAITLPSKLAPGYYLMRASINNNVVTKPIVIQ
jgi:hypothetical protein